jgi:hypothetical protein
MRVTCFQDLKLTAAQACRLWNLNENLCAEAPTGFVIVPLFFIESV